MSQSNLPIYLEKNIFLSFLNWQTINYFSRLTLEFNRKFTILYNTYYNSHVILLLKIEDFRPFNCWIRPITYVNLLTAYIGIQLPLYNGFIQHKENPFPATLRMEDHKIKENGKELKVFSMFEMSMADLFSTYWVRQKILISFIHIKEDRSCQSLSYTFRETEDVNLFRTYFWR